MSGMRKDGDGTLVKATTPTALFPHSPASASIVSVCDVPQNICRYSVLPSGIRNVPVGSKTSQGNHGQLVHTGAGKYFYPLFERMHELLIQRELIHADETTCQVLREEGKAAESISYMWIYLSGNDGPASNHPI